LTIRDIYARLRKNSIKPMTEKEQCELDVFDTVQWCFKRAEKVNQADAEALYDEFNEWIEYVEDDSVEFIDVTKLNLPSK
jgi:hypothetical protein